MNKFYLTLSVILFTNLLFSQKICNVQKINLNAYFSNFNAYYTNTVTSPNGKYALLTGEKFKGISILDLKRKKITQITTSENSGYGYCWAPDSKTFFYKVNPSNGYISDSKVYSYDLKTKETKETEIDPNFLPSYNGDSNIVVYTNTKTLKIEAIDLITKKTWIITKDEGQFYSPILSHDKSKVVVHKGSDIIIYDINGSSEGLKIGIGIATSWSKNDKYIIGFLDESLDGHNIKNSDIYIFNTSSYNPIKITNTNNIFEMFPCFYGKNKILFTDDKTGALYSADLKF